LTKIINAIQIKITGDRIDNVPRNFKFESEGVSPKEAVEILQQAIDHIYLNGEDETHLIFSEGDKYEGDK